MSAYSFAQMVKKPFRRACIWGDKKFFDPSVTPLSQQLEESYPSILSETKSMMQRYDDFAPFQDISPDQTYISNDDRWRMFFLKGAGVTFKRNAAHFPTLMSVLNKHRGVVSAYLSVLGPQKILNPHEGPWAGVLRMHMGLIIPDPDKCHINVEGDKYHWDNGKVVLFDDTYNHYAVNETDQLRVILFIDYMRPMRFPYNLLNWTVMKMSWAFPYIWRPLWRHRRWSQKFYAEKLPVT